MGIYNGLYNITPDVLPPQSISLKEKMFIPKDPNQKSWGQKCMDALETIGKTQFNTNLKLIENYEMIKGRFVFSHYFHTEGYDSMLNQLTAQLELPNYLRHYDIIGQVVNTMSGEQQTRPDVFKIRQVGEAASNEYLRIKTELTKNYVLDKINKETDRKLLDLGYDLNKNDFNTEEEATAYQKQIGDLKNKLSPVDIQKYMDTGFLTIAEIWAQNQKDIDREYFNLPEKEKVEFEDSLIADRCFRHFYLTHNGYNQETWNPINVFFQKSQDTVYVEDGDFVGRIFSLSINTIIDRYGFLMSKEDFDLLNGKISKGQSNWDDKEYNWVYDNYLVPFKGYHGYDIMKKGWAAGSQGDVEMVDDSFFKNLNSNSFFKEKDGYYFVTESYWKSQKTLIKVTYLDFETNSKVVEIVDENFIIPKQFKESKNIFDSEHDINTYCETKVTEVWKGIKINTSVDKTMVRDLYLDIKPNDFQFKGDLNIYGSKLPVCGQIFSVRNSKSMSLVDLMKPYQIAYNVCQNQIYQLMEKEIGMFVVMDVNMFPNSKDWGGEDSWEKWMLVAKNYGLLPADTSPQNVKNSMAATGGFLPKVLDLNLASQMLSRVNLSKFFEEQALKQVGFNQYRTGSYSAEATATGVREGAAKSYSQTESYFTNFNNYLRRCLQMSLNIAQFVESKKPSISILNIKSDFSKAFIKILGTDILLADLGVFVSNSQEHARQLEMIRQYALQNNTSGMSPVDVSSIIMMNNPNEIRNQLKVSFDKLMEQEAQKQQMVQATLEQDKLIADNKLQQEDRHFQEKLQNELDKVKITAGVAILNSDERQIVSPVDNSFRDNLALEQNNSNNNYKQQKLQLDKDKLKLDNSYKQNKLALDQAKISADLQIQNKETESVKILKGKDLP